MAPFNEDTCSCCGAAESFLCGSEEEYDEDYESLIDYEDDDSFTLSSYPDDRTIMSDATYATYTTYGTVATNSDSVVTSVAPTTANPQHQQRKKMPVLHEGEPLRLDETKSPANKAKSTAQDSKAGQQQTVVRLLHSPKVAMADRASAATSIKKPAVAPAGHDNQIKGLGRLQSMKPSSPSSLKSISSRSTKSIVVATSKTGSILRSNMADVVRHHLSVPLLGAKSKDSTKTGSDATSSRHWNRPSTVYNKLDSVEEGSTPLEIRDDDSSRMPTMYRVSDIPKKDSEERESADESDGQVEGVGKSKNTTSTKIANAAGALGGALNFKKHIVAHDAIKRANALEAIARKQSDLGQWNLAEKNYTEALQIKRGALEDDKHAEIIKTNDLLGMARLEQGNFAGAIKPIEDALLALRRSKGPDDPQVINRLHSLAFLCRISGNTTKLAAVEKEIGKVCRVPSL